MNMQLIADKVNEIVDEVLELDDDVQIVSADKLGLDIRAGCTIYMGTDFLAVTLYNDRTLQYYGNFEYIKEEYKFHAGDYVFYSRENYRVGRCFEFFEDNLVEENCNERRISAIPGHAT